MRRGRRARGLLAAALVAAAGLVVVEVVLVAGSTRSSRIAGPSVQSVPWHLVRATGSQMTVGWGAGTCDSALKPRPAVKVVETHTTVTLAVLVHVVQVGRNACAGVGLGGAISAAVAYPLGHRRLVDGTITGRDEGEWQ